MRSLPLLRQWVGGLKLIRLAERETEDNCVMVMTTVMCTKRNVCIRSGCFGRTWTDGWRMPQESKNNSFEPFPLPELFSWLLILNEFSPGRDWDGTGTGTDAGLPAGSAPDNNTGVQSCPLGIRKFCVNRTATSIASKISFYPSGEMGHGKRWAVLSSRPINQQQIWECLNMCVFLGIRNILTFSITLWFDLDVEIHNFHQK